MKLTCEVVQNILTEEDLGLLRQMWISTAREFVAAKVDTLAKRLARKALSLEEATTRVKAVRRWLLRRWPLESAGRVDPAPRPISALPTGVDGLDLRPGCVYEVYGPPGAGKTQLALTTCAQCLALGATSTVAYLDAKGDFRPERLLQMLMPMREVFKGRLTALDQVRVRRTRGCEQAVATLQAVAGRLDHDEAEDLFWRDLRLVVVDNVASIASFDLANKGVKRTSVLMNQLAVALKRICVVNGTSALVVNHTNFKNRGDSVELTEGPALGKLVSSVADVRLRLWPKTPLLLQANEVKLRTLSVERDRQDPWRKDSWLVHVTSEGLRKSN